VGASDIEEKVGARKKHRALHLVNHGYLVYKMSHWRLGGRNENLQNGAELVNGSAILAA
jgi:hypothetical protein